MISEKSEIIRGEIIMSDIDVRILRLEPMRVASAYGFGDGPEGKAWDQLLTWAKGKGLLENPTAHRFFGFNNPDPSPASPNYGYEQWMTVETGLQPEGEIRVKDFPGGLYAVTHCRLSRIGETWQQFVAWREDSRYKPAHHQWLEECLTPPLSGEIGDLEFDLYMPVAE